MKTNKEILKEFKMFVPEDDGSATDWIKNTLEAKDKECDEKVREGKIGLLNELKLGFATRGVDKGKDTILWDATQLCKLMDDIAFTLTPTKTDEQ